MAVDAIFGLVGHAQQVQLVVKEGGGGKAGMHCVGGEDDGGRGDVAVVGEEVGLRTLPAQRSWPK